MGLLSPFGAAFGAPLGSGGASSAYPDFSPCTPESSYSTDEWSGANWPLVGRSPSSQDSRISDAIQFTPPPDLGFCSDWNPEFVNNGHHCCGRFVAVSRRRMNRKKLNRCAPERIKSSYCDEMTSDQRAYTDAAEKGALGDVLELISSEMGQRGAQSFCTVNNGFLAWGRRLVPSSVNRVQLRTPARCVDFGSDGMVGLLEWTGREIAKEYSDPEYSGVRFLIGDVSAPRGGCLSGRSGRRGHASHTAGLDADVGFLVAKARRASPSNFHQDFDAKTNWWLLKRVFKNPFACVKVIFLDRRMINKLAKVASRDPEWEVYRRFLRHMPGHKNHFHIRVGSEPGRPGCVKDANDARPELEVEEDVSEGLAPGSGQEAIEDLLLDLNDSSSPENGAE